MSVSGVYVQSNEGDGNRVFVFSRGDDGQLSAPVIVSSGGRGDDVPHLTSQGSVVLASDGRLLVTNAGSGDISVLAIAAEPKVVAVVSSGGAAPKSIVERDGLVYVLNTGDRSLVGFRLTKDELVEIAGSRRELEGGADPAQVGFAPDGKTVVVTDRGANAVLVYPVGADGLLGEPKATPSAGPTPYGFTFARDDTLVVTEAFGAAKGKAAASSYRVGADGAKLVTSSVGNGRSEICWAVPSADGRYVFTTNFADGAVSCDSVSPGGELVLDNAAAAAPFDGVPGLRDEDITEDGRFLYAIDADGGRVFGWRVDEGTLSPLGSWNGLPTTVAGLAAN